MSDAIRKLCTFCARKADLICSGCYTIRYCSEWCQRGDRSAHKLICTTIQEFAEPPKPEFKRAIFFPSEEELPRFIWIETKEDRSGTFAYMDLDEWLDLSGDKLFNIRRSIPLPPVNDARSKRALRHKLVVHYRAHFKVDGSTPNQSIIKATKGKQKAPWKGPLMVLAHKVNGTREPPFDDVTAHDLRDLVDWFCRFNGNSASVSPLQPIFDIQAIRINAPDQVEMTRCPEYVPVTIKSDHPMFSAKPNEHAITTRIGLPLRVHPLPSGWQSTSHFAPNTAAVYLDMNAFGPRIGKPSREWDCKREGSTANRNALVARFDQKDLLLEHLCVVADFCKHHITRPMELMDDWETIERHIAMRCTKEKFEEYWAMIMIDQQIKACHENPESPDMTWLDIAWPFDVEGGPVLW